MANQTIGIGTTPNDRSGDKLRVAFDKINDNFIELYAGAPLTTIAPVAGTIGTETPLDLTKAVHKLDTGDYSLADGVEGQILYLVSVDDAASGAVVVVVDNLREDGVPATDVSVIPFLVSGVGLVALIFTDGCWQF